MSKIVRGLDLFCGGGGCTNGYMRGFRNRGVRLEMWGVDFQKHPRYLDAGGYRFICEDAVSMLYDASFINSFDFLHLSPPCQAHSQTRSLTPVERRRTKDLVTPCLEILKEKYAHKPWIMENVPQAPMYSRVDQMLRLCGSSFPELTGFDERRQLHRHRDLRLHGFKVPKLACAHSGYKPISIYGSLNSGPPGGGEEPANFKEACKLMGIDWMIWSELKEAVPPAFTQYVSEAPGGLVDLLG